MNAPIPRPVPATPAATDGRCGASALEDSLVCDVPLGVLEQLFALSPAGLRAATCPSF